MKQKTKFKLLLLLVIYSTFVVCSENKNKEQDKADFQSFYLESMEDLKPLVSTDSYVTNQGELSISVLGHASLLIKFHDKFIYVDPYSKVADYTTKPKADLILLTHEHPDHLDTIAINEIKKSNTHFIGSRVVCDILGYGEALNNGQKTAFGNVSIEAVPAYNIVSKRPDGEFYHPKGRGNGYVLTFGDKKVYIAGDTENIPEMKDLSNINIAFLPKNLPYTMTDNMFIDATETIKPEYLYPYHFSEFDKDKIEGRLNDNGIKLLVRPMITK